MGLPALLCFGRNGVKAHHKPKGGPNVIGSVMMGLVPHFQQLKADTQLIAPPGRRISTKRFKVTVGLFFKIQCMSINHGLNQPRRRAVTGLC